MADWSRVVNTTIKNYIKGEEVNILRNRKLLAMLKAKGRLTFNWGGDTMVWRVRYRRAPMQGYMDSETLTFPRRDRWKSAELDWRGYAMTDSMTKGEKLKNKGVQQIINIYDQIARSLMEDITENFADELYINGNAAGNSKRIHGIESFLADAGTAPSGGLVANPSATFATLKTDLQAYGGNWSGSWPTGTGDAHYDFWAPLLVDYTSSKWLAGAAPNNTWQNNCVEATRYGIIKSQKNKTLKGRLSTIIYNDELYRQFLAALDDRERIVVQSNASNSTLIKLGFTDVQNFDGVDLTYEFGTPANLGYGFNFDQMEMRSMQGQMFVPEGPDYDIASKSWRFSIDFYGNCVWNPRYFLKFKNYGLS
jgi:hypothetical protein